MFHPDCSLSAFCLLCFSLLHRQKGAGNLPGGCPQSTVDKSIFWIILDLVPVLCKPLRFIQGWIASREGLGWVRQCWEQGSCAADLALRWCRFLCLRELAERLGFGESRSANQRRASLLFWECEPWVAVAEELLSSVLYIQMLLGISAGIAWTAGDEVLILAALCWKCTCNWHLIKYECFSLGG